jgi:hypothetical protein
MPTAQRFGRDNLEVAQVKGLWPVKKIALFTLLWVTLVSGCSAIANSERFYRERPSRPINWREYSAIEYAKDV